MTKAAATSAVQKDSGACMNVKVNLVLGVGLASGELCRADGLLITVLSASDSFEFRVPSFGIGA